MWLILLKQSIVENMENTNNTIKIDTDVLKLSIKEVAENINDKSTTDKPITTDKPKKYTFHVLEGVNVDFVSLFLHERIYINISVDNKGRVVSVFCNSKNISVIDSSFGLLFVMLSKLIESNVHKQNFDIRTVLKHFYDVSSGHRDIVTPNGKMVKSVYGEIANAIETTLVEKGYLQPLVSKEENLVVEEKINRAGGLTKVMLHDIICPNCQSTNMISLEGCPRCLDCGYSKCS